jgi:hypothetical protein
VLERRRAVRETREEEAKKMQGGRRGETLGCSEGREEVNCCFNKRLRISIHHPVAVKICRTTIEQSIYDIPDTSAALPYVYSRSHWRKADMKAKQIDRLNVCLRYNVNAVDM